MTAYLPFKVVNEYEVQYSKGSSFNIITKDFIGSGKEAHDGNLREYSL
jgi:hypothetical protein